MTRKACIIGHPVKHSRSPLIHGYWLRQLGIDGAYERADVAPRELADFLRALPERGYAGANVTVPHKERAFALADELTERARAIGSVNTVWFEDGKLCADSTDGAGFLAHLDESAPGWADGKGHAVLLGAGGGARGVAHALASRGVGRIVIVNRDLDRAERLAAEMSGATALSWRDLPIALAGASLLINATARGMNGQEPLDIPLAGLSDDAVVDDIVYVPLETTLLSAARARGLRAVDGLGMLLHQAAPGFARWFGQTPAVTQELRALIVADIEKPA